MELKAFRITYLTKYKTSGNAFVVASDIEKALKFFRGWMEAQDGADPAIGVSTIEQLQGPLLIEAREGMNYYN